MKINIDKLSLREKVLAFTALVVILIVLGLGQIISPWLEKYRSLRKTSLSQHMRLMKYEQLISDEKSLRSQYQEMQGIIKSSTSTEEEMSKLLRDVDELCRNTGIKIIDIKPLDITEKESVKSIHVEIEAESSQLNFGRLLYELKYSPIMLQINAFKVSLGSRGEALKCHIVFSRLIS